MARKKSSGNSGKGRKPAAKQGKSRKSTSNERAKSSAKQRPKFSKDLLNIRLMKALSHELRVKIFSVLTERIASPNELATMLDEGLSQVSYHVKVLEDYELIELVETQPRRGAVEHYYRAVRSTLIPPGSWDNLPPRVRRGVSVSILKAFLDDARASLKAGVFDKDPGSLGWTPLILDSQGLNKVAKLAHEFQKAVADVQVESSGRLSKLNGKGAKEATSATVFLAHFLSARSPREGKKAFAAKLR